jgi:transposase-like protein
MIRGSRRSIRPHPHSHPFEVRRKAVQLYLEEGFSPELIARQMGVGKSTLSKWVKLYRDQGEAGLQSKPRRPRPKVAAAVKTQVVELKRDHPDLGIVGGQSMWGRWTGLDGIGWGRMELLTHWKQKRYKDTHQIGAMHSICNKLRGFCTVCAKTRHRGKVLVSGVGTNSVSDPETRRGTCGSQRCVRPQC